MIAVQEKEEKEPSEHYSHSGCGTYHLARPNPEWIAWAKKQIRKLSDEPDVFVDFDPGCDVEACQLNSAWVEWAKQEMARLKKL